MKEADRKFLVAIMELSEMAKDLSRGLLAPESEHRQMLLGGVRLGLQRLLSRLDAQVPTAPTEEPKAWYWGGGVCPEVYEGGPFPTKEAAISDAESTLDPGLPYEVVCARPVKLRDDFFSYEQVTEQFEEANEEAWGEDGPTVHTLPRAAGIELERRLAETFKAWRAEFPLWRAHTLTCMSDREERVTSPEEAKEV